MTEIQRIEDQLKKAFEGGAWHGPAVLEVLEGVSAGQAARRPIGAAHSIWEIVLHMATWESVVARRLRGEPVKDVPSEMDWPRVKTTGEAEWRAALERLKGGHADLGAVLRGVRDDLLEQPPAEGATTRYVLLHGVIQHDLYHAGQIAVLKKA